MMNNKTTIFTKKEAINNIGHVLSQQREDKMKKKNNKSSKTN